MRLLESGIIQRWSKELLTPQVQCTTSESNLDGQTLSLEDTAGVFIICGIGLGMSLLGLVVEVMFYFCVKLHKES